MQLEVQKQIPAGPYERSGKRKGHHNGSRQRFFKTIHGDIALDKPEIREFPLKIKYSRNILAWRAYSNDQSLLRVAVCIMMDINGDWVTGNEYSSLEE